MKDGGKGMSGGRKGMRGRSWRMKDGGKGMSGGEKDER
jgi:hypothetical protein